MKKAALYVIRNTIKAIKASREVYYNGPDGKKKRFNKAMLKPMQYIEKLIVKDMEKIK